ncbi:hypothetical protein AAY473_002922, partial [Plecturocebus cupreus]
MAEGKKLRHPMCWELHRRGFTMLARLVPNSCPQVIHLPQLPKVLGLQSIIAGRSPGHHPDLKADCEGGGSQQEGTVLEVEAERKTVELAPTQVDGELAAEFTVFPEWAGRKVERGRHPFKNTHCSPAQQVRVVADPLPALWIQEDGETEVMEGALDPCPALLFLAFLGPWTLLPAPSRAYTSSPPPLLGPGGQIPGLPFQGCHCHGNSQLTGPLLWGSPPGLLSREEAERASLPWGPGGLGVGRKWKRQNVLPTNTILLSPERERDRGVTWVGDKRATQKTSPNSHLENHPTEASEPKGFLNRWWRKILLKLPGALAEAGLAFPRVPGPRPSESSSAPEAGHPIPPTTHNCSPSPCSWVRGREGTRGAGNRPWITSVPTISASCSLESWVEEREGSPAFQCSVQVKNQRLNCGAAGPHRPDSLTTGPVLSQSSMEENTAPTSSFKVLWAWLDTLLMHSVTLRWGSSYMAQAGLELLGSGDPPASASQSAGITSMSHCTQLLLLIIE